MFNYNVMLMSMFNNGFTCPLRAQWPQIRELAAHPTAHGKVEQQALVELQEIGKGLAAGKPASGVAIQQQNLKDQYGNSMTLFYGIKSTANGPFYILYVKPEDRGRLQQHKQWFHDQGLDRPMTEEQSRHITDVRYAMRNPPPKPTVSAPKVSGSFVRYSDMNESQFWETVARANQNPTLGSYYKEFFFGGVRLNFEIFRSGCANVETAFGLALTQYLPQELASKCPKNYWAAERQFVAAGMELLQGLAIMAGATAGAVALGAAAGGVVGSVVPVLGTGAGASAGASIAFMLANWIATAAGFAADAVTYKGFADGLTGGFNESWSGNVQSGARKLAVAIAGILGAILIYMIMRRLFKKPKGKELEKVIEEEENDAAALSKPHPHEQPPHPDLKSRLPKPLNPGERPIFTPANFRPACNLKVLDVAADFKPEIDSLNKDLKALEKLMGTLEGVEADKRKWPILAKGLESYKNRPAEYRAFFRETLGHIRVVQSGAQMGDAYLAALKRSGGITPANVKRLFPALNDLEAEVAANKLREIKGSLADAFRRHDADGPGSKLGIPVAKGMSLPESRALYQWKDLQKAHPGKSDEELIQIVRQDQQALQKLLDGFQVDSSILKHNDAYAHHHPQTGQDWVEFGIDVVAAICQKRNYKPKFCRPSEFRCSSELGRTESIVESAFLKIGRQLLDGVEQLKGPEFIQHPQNQVQHLI